MSFQPSIDACLLRSTAGPTFSCPPTSIVQTPAAVGSATFDVIQARTRQSRMVVLTGAARVASSGLLISAPGMAWTSVKAMALNAAAHSPRRLCAPQARTSTAARGLDGGDVDLPHRHHRVEGTLCLTAAGRKRVGQRARRDLPGEPPAVLAPAARAFLAAIADDRVPVAVRFLLIVRRDLKRKRLALPEGRTTVEPEAGDAEDRELHRELIALLAAGEVTRRPVHGGHAAIRKGGGVKLRGRVRALVEPQADRVLRLHGRALLFPRGDTGAARRQRWRTS